MIQTQQRSGGEALQETCIPGVVISHVPAASRMYVGSPGLAVLPDGTFVATHDIFGPGSTEHELGVTLVFRSGDKGRTWSRIARVEGMFWGTLFVHDRSLYLLGADRHYGNAVIRRSIDSGVTWTEPNDAASGLLLTNAGYHCAPVPVLIHGGRIWRAMEDREGRVKGWGRHFRAFMLSAPVEADLLQASNWTCSNRIDRDPSWLGGRFDGWLEGNAVATPDGRIVDILRVASEGISEKAAIVEVSADGRTATFDPEMGFVDFPGGSKKFTIRFDAQSSRYWTLSNYIPERHFSNDTGAIRNVLALACSTNLSTWELRTVVLYHPDPLKHAFQYVEWLVDGEDLIVASRTAYDDGLGGAHTQHDANLLTFHRIHRFRALTMVDACEPWKRAFGTGGAGT